MSITEKRRRLIIQLREHIELLDHSLDTLLYSFEKCKKIKVDKWNLDLEEQESFEALTGRFARTSDLLTQKVLKTIFIILQEDVKTFIDAANFIEKIGIVRTADDILNIRELRNQISHEYIEDNLDELFKDVLSHIPMLEDIVKSVKDYSELHIVNHPI